MALAVSGGLMMLCEVTAVVTVTVTPPGTPDTCPPCPADTCGSPPRSRPNLDRSNFLFLGSISPNNYTAVAKQSAHPILVTRYPVFKKEINASAG